MPVIKSKTFFFTILLYCLMFSAYRELVFLKFLLPFTGGILLAIYAPVSFAPLLMAMAISFFVLVTLYEYRPFATLKPSWQWVTGIPINLLMCAIGIMSTHVHQEINDRFHFSRHYLENSPWIAKVTEPPTLIDSTYKLKAEVITVFEGKKATGTNGKIILYLPLDDNSGHLKYGDLLGLCAPIKETVLPANPYEFDSKSYYGWQQYYHQATAYPNQWRPLGINQGNAFFKWIYHLRNTCTGKLELYLRGKPLAITASLLLGYRDFMDKDLTKTYTAAGVIHILSVSGMHLGVVIWIGSWLFGLLGLPEKYRWIQQLALILLVWLFACLTGLAPSVLRAAVIATFLISGKLLRRDSNTLNALAASALLLLAFNPFLLMDIGFQLSYLAVTGLLMMYPALYLRGYFKYAIFNTLYGWIVLSICATIATLPLTLYYFHQASIYFTISNLIAVPLSSLIMIGGALVLVLSPLHQLAVYLAKATSWLVLVMDWLITQIVHLPMAQIKGIALMKDEAYILGLAVALLLMATYAEKAKLLWLSLMVTICFFCYGIDAQTAQQEQSKMIVYSINRHTAIDIIEGKHDVLLADDSLLQDEDNIERYISPCRWYSGLNEPIRECMNEDSSQFQWQTVWRNGKYMQVHGKRILLVANWKRTIPPKIKLPIDYLVITHNANVKLSELAQSFQPALVIFDGANSIRKTEAMISQCKDLKWTYHDTRTQGAYVHDFNPQSPTHLQWLHTLFATVRQ